MSTNAAPSLECSGRAQCVYFNNIFLEITARAKPGV